MKKVTVSLTGGLGNQMFQYAAGRALSLRLAVPLVLDLSWFQRSFRPEIMTRRHYELGDFPNLTNHHIVAPYPLPTKITKLLSVVKAENFVEEAATTPEKFESLNGKSSTRLIGYWQNMAYFQSITETLRTDFGLNYDNYRRDNHMLPRLKPDATLGVHVRRGDYVTLSEHVGANRALPISYYLNAIEYVVSVRDIRLIVVVSDDPEWCRKHFTDSRCVFVNTGNRSIEDFSLLQSCDHHVISNSSFSWWAAWLPRSS
ncbi:MAG: alpha-1,2-fucosyltransferase, partial [Acidimicrobiaceae bacterium]|nr:alpha-1,2-fucosyltransferase [Acidimicrobiaceae bacterium]